MTVGERIKAARKKGGMSQKELADKLGIPYQGISQYERGVRKPKAATLFRIAEILEVSYIDLILEDAAEYQKNTYWGRITSIYYDLIGLSCGEFAEAFRQCFPQLNEQGQKKLTAYLQDLIKIEDYHQEPLPKPKDKGPGRVAPFANSDPEPSKSVSQDLGKEE